MLAFLIGIGQRYQQGSIIIVVNVQHYTQAGAAVNTTSESANHACLWCTVVACMPMMSRGQ